MTDRIPLDELNSDQYDALLDELDHLRAASADRAAGFREAADEIAGIDFHPNAVVRSLELAAGLARRLRRMADEAQQAT